MQAASLPSHQHDWQHLRVLSRRPRLRLWVLNPVLHRVRADVDEGHPRTLQPLPPNPTPRWAGLSEIIFLKYLFIIKFILCALIVSHFFHLNQQVLAIVLWVRIQKLFLSPFISGMRATKGFFLRRGTWIWTVNTTYFSSNYSINHRSFMSTRRTAWSGGLKAEVRASDVGFITNL